MTTNRTHAGLDGTLLFESLAAEVAREYFGERAQSLVFGTSATNGSFPQRVDDLCSRLGEGGGFRSDGERRTSARDGKLDIVAWKPFTDGLPGKLIGFGQCKTGTNYGDSLAQLQPSAFCGKWMRDSIVASPIRMFFISESLDSSEALRYEISHDAGVVFDRCRIVEFCETVSPELIKKVERWTLAAAKATDLPTSW